MLIIRRATANRLDEISREAAADLLSHRDANLWLHFDTPTEEELHFLKENFAIHHLTIEDIVNQNQRPKIEPFEDYVYLAIYPLRREAKWEIKPSELDLLLGRGWIVSVHYGPLPGLIDNSQLHERIPVALGGGADFLLYTLVDLVVDSYFPIMDDIEDEIDTLRRPTAPARAPRRYEQAFVVKALDRSYPACGHAERFSISSHAMIFRSFGRKIWFISATSTIT